MSYQIPIKRTKIKKKHMTSMHLVAGFMAILIAAILLVVPERVINTLPMLRNPLAILSALAGLVFIISSIAFNKALSKTKNNTILRIFEIAIFGLLVVYTSVNQWWMHAIYAGVGLAAVLTTYVLEIRAHKPEYITIDENGVHLKKWGTKTIDWCEVKNFLIRHGNVTINLRNNTLYQYEAFEFSKMQQKETMEAFALKNIEANAHRYQPDW